MASHNSAACKCLYKVRPLFVNLYGTSHDTWKSIIAEEVKTWEQRDFTEKVWDNMQEMTYALLMHTIEPQLFLMATVTDISHDLP